MNEMQRNANREFTPTIIKFMQTAYDFTRNEQGTGCYARMKNHMVGHVDQARHQMFGAATQTVRDHLKQMCKELEDSMATKVDEIYLNMQRDYMQVLGGRQLTQGDRMSKTEHDMRSEIWSILQGVDKKFERLSRGELESEMEVGGEDMDKEQEVESSLRH